MHFFGRPIVMRTRVAGVGSSFALGMCLIFSSADAQAGTDLLGPYAGLGVGYAHLSQNFTVPGSVPMSFSPNRTVWKLLVGARPLPWLGPEFEYVNFGDVHAGPNSTPSSVGPQVGLYGADAHAYAGTASLVGYLPPLSSWLELYGKAGFAYLRTYDSYSGYFPANFVHCPGACTPLGLVALSESHRSTGFVYGGGVRLHTDQFAARLDFEDVHSKPAGNPYLVSLVTTWTF